MIVYQYYIALPPIKANSEKEAEDTAYALLKEYAESNDGSEFLANAEILVKEDLH